MSELLVSSLGTSGNKWNHTVFAFRLYLCVSVHICQFFSRSLCFMLEILPENCTWIYLNACIYYTGKPPELWNILKIKMGDKIYLVNMGNIHIFHISCEKIWNWYTNLLEKGHWNSRKSNSSSFIRIFMQPMFLALVLLCCIRLFML